MKRFILGIDIGGTKLAGGLLTRKGRLVEFQSEPTIPGLHPGLNQVLNMISRLLERAGGRGNVSGVGISAPGPLDPRRGFIMNPPNLPGWHNVPLGVKVRQRFRLPTRVENDANAAGLAETLFGAARGCRDVFYATVSTGIGTGILIDRRIYHGKNGVAGEGGHVSIDHRSPWRCGCGSQGCIEALASGTAMARRARMRLGQEAEAGAILREMTRGDPEQVTAEAIAKAARAGDVLSQGVIEETALYLGIWLASMVNLLDPEAVVIGGGVSLIGAPLFKGLRRTVRLHAYTLRCIHACPTPILPAELGTQVGVFGAASLFLA
jgi:glucokinase